ncbi:MAG: family 2 glycosyl transferase [Deltaproteobacteria bacterium HGW-Deltaproteobacteria-1]|nr:MAG: family 2 glycosyl transferase [Deltaproteobacteria bacterium HGW-Deltaproteobacteria-1]
MNKTQIVVPCYNESKRIKAEAFLGALEKDPNLSFLFVNDGSTDDTFNLLQSLKEKKSRQIEILNLEKNSGKAEAVRRGMLKSLEGPFDNIGYWDADLATPVSAIEVFCRLLDSRDAEIVMGSRVRLLGRNIQRKAARHYLGRIFATCASFLLNINIYDTQCGAKIFRASDSLKKVFQKPFKVHWTFDVEMFARFPIVTGKTLAEISSRWVECPLDEWFDVQGSNIKPKHFIKGGGEFLMLCLYLRTPARKIYEKYLLES